MTNFKYLKISIQGKYKNIKQVNGLRLPGKSSSAIQ